MQPWRAPHEHNVEIFEISALQFAVTPSNRSAPISLCPTPPRPCGADFSSPALSSSSHFVSHLVYTCEALWRMPAKEGSYRRSSPRGSPRLGAARRFYSSNFMASSQLAGALGYNLSCRSANASAYQTLALLNFSLRPLIFFSWYPSLAP